MVGDRSFVGFERELVGRSLSVNQLEMLGEALLDFQGIRDLEAWLAG